MLTPGRTYSATNSYRYGFNGKENDEKDGVIQYDYGFRIYDPRLGRFKSVDPLKEHFPWNSTYAYAEGDVLRAIDVDGLEKVIVHTVSFAPFNYFGADYWGTYVGNGNNRKFGDDIGSTVVNGTTIENYKMRSEAAIDLTTMKETSHQAIGGTAKYIPFKKGHGIIPLRHAQEVKGTASFEGGFYSGSVAGYPNTTLGLDYHLTSSNPAAISIFGVKLNADIDVNVKINFWKTDKKGEIGVNGEVNGDRFPANENYLVDEKNNKLFLGISGVNDENGDNAPYTELPGDNHRKMSDFHLTILFNDDNTFKGVRTPSGKEYSLADWNKLFIGLDPRSSKTGTSVGSSTNDKDNFKGTVNK